MQAADEVDVQPVAVQGIVLFQQTLHAVFADLVDPERVRVVDLIGGGVFGRQQQLVGLPVGRRRSRRVRAGADGFEIVLDIRKILLFVHISCLS